MTSAHPILISAISVACLGTLHAAGADAHARSVSSPNGAISLRFDLDQEGSPHYSVTYKDKPLLLSSGMGLRLKDAPGLSQGFSISDSSTSAHDRIWKPVAGERSDIRDHYNELNVDLAQKGESRLRIQFRIHDAGAAFCYFIPQDRAFSPWKTERNPTPGAMPQAGIGWAVGPGSNEADNKEPQKESCDILDAKQRRSLRQVAPPQAPHKHPPKPILRPDPKRRRRSSLPGRRTPRTPCLTRAPRVRVVGRGR